MAQAARVRGDRPEQTQKPRPAKTRRSFQLQSLLPLAAAAQEQLKQPWQKAVPGVSSIWELLFRSCAPSERAWCAGA